MPRTAEEVSKAIRFATANKIPFNVCGGGHSTSGQSSSDGGMVIDLRLMNDVHVDTSNNVVHYGGGCKWAEVDAAAWEHGLATVGGTVNHTGVGGLVLGGGFGWLSPRYGLTIDVLVSVEMVLADGSIVTASEAENQDLFWAIRGAGTSFGVATRFTSRAFPQSNVYAGALIFPRDRLSDVVGAVNEFLATHTGEQALLMTVNYGPPPDRLPVTAVQLFHNGTQAEAEQVFAPFLRLGPLINLAKEIPYVEVNGLSNAIFTHNRRWQFGGANVTTPLNAALVEEVADTFFRDIDRFSADPSKEDMRGSAFGFEIVPNDKVREVPPESTSFMNRGDYYNALLLMNWLDPARDAEVRRWKQGLAEKLRSGGFSGDEVGRKGVGQYNNYEDQAMSAEKAFGANAKRLRELKKKFDPENHFDKLWKLT